jgi:protein associated with RNAse G/E
MTGNDLSGVQIGVNNGSANNVNATNNYWGGCPSVSGPVSYFPYHTSVNGTPGDFEFGPTISNIVASSTNSSTICAGLSTTIFASGGSNYVWDNGLGLGASKVVGPLVNTTYNVTGNDANGCAGAFDDVVIGVNAAPVVKINGEINGTSTIPSAQQVVLTASGAVSYLWSTAETTESITVYPTSVTSYSVVGTTGDCTATATHTITPIIVSAGPNKFICSGNLTTLTATVIGATPASFLWSPGGAITQSIEIAPNTTTVYTVTVTVGGSNPSASVTVFVNSKPVANAGADITIAPAGSGILTGSASNGTAPYSYSWNTTPVQTTANATVSATANAYETYSLTVTDAYGCTSSADNATVTVANTGYTVSGNVAYANLVNNQMHNVTVTLKQDGTTMYSTTTPLTGNGNYEFLGVANGTYTVHLSSPKPWGGVTSADIIAIQNHYKTPNPVLLNGIKRLAADVVDNSSSAIVILNDRTMVNNKRVNPNGVSFATGNWVFAKTAEIGNNGIDYANSIGSTISITVLDGAVTQNFSALCYGDVDASYTGLKENENSILDATAVDGLSLINFPNPFSDVTTIQYNMPVEGSAVVDIFDLIGNKVASISDPEKSEGVHNLNFNASGMASGIYIYTVTVKTSDDIIIQNGKMIFSK